MARVHAPAHPHPHPADDELLAYGDGLLAPEQAAAVSLHVADCASCRAVIAAVARVSTIAPTSVDDDDADARGAPLPAELLRQSLDADGAKRERVASALAGCVVVVAAALLGASMFAGGARAIAAGPLVVLGAVAAYELTVFTLLGRGRFHPALPYVNTSVEVLLFFVMQGYAAAAVGPEHALSAPVIVGLGAQIVFTAIRLSPRLSIVTGLVAAAATLAFYFAVEDALVRRDLPPLQPAGAFIQAGLCVVAGVAGALVARYFIARADAALRAIREQDWFGKYVLHERIGRGGMGEVFRATYAPEGGFRRTVAVKRVRAELAGDARFVAAFRREAELCAGLVHPNLVQVFDFGRFRGSVVVAMELVEGVSLARLLRGGRALPAGVVAYLGAELAAGLAYVHAKRDATGRPLALVHCDVNPPNVFVSRTGEVKLADFGVARAGAVDGTRGAFAGKIVYAAPEQLHGDDVDERADLYALGLLLFEALTGRRAFRTDDEALAGTPLPPLSTAAPHAPAALAALVDELCARERGRRPRTAESVRARLLALDGDAAPYPNAAAALATLVCNAGADTSGHAPLAATEPAAAAATTAPLSTRPERSLR